MEALAIVTCTLLGFAALLFGSDSLDRRLSLRAGRPLVEPAAPGDQPEVSLAGAVPWGSPADAVADAGAIEPAVVDGPTPEPAAA